MNDPQIRILVTDDHPVVRDGLRSVIAHQADMTVVGEAENGQRAVELFRQLLPDVVLMDLRMPVMGGVDAIRALTSEHPSARVLALTTYEGDADIFRALEAGARGYLLKEMLLTEAISAIRAVYSGARVIPPAVAARLAEFTPRVDLTDREVEVLAYMAKGLTNKEIGALLGRAEGTIKVHVLHILQKLEASDRTEAVTLALQRGIIHLP